MRAFINTARPVRIGNEVGIGTGSAIYTHGAYQSPLDGFPLSFAPVSIGDNCWLPGATVNPGVTIGPNTVIAVGSVVTRDIPAGSLAGGVPCRVIKENAYPRPLSVEERRRFLDEFLRTAGEILADCKLVPADCAVVDDGSQLCVGDTTFDLITRSVSGPSDARTEKVRDLLRRHGIRFFAEVAGNVYRDWRHDV
uniref:Acetyltransferase n=1 Tax=candidate division WOR-3 bacterium TaxID=2052148 RepID=A0A7C4CAX8_UNCW3